MSYISTEDQKYITYYINEKINMLEKEFCLKLTPEEKQYFHTLKTDRAVDLYAHNLMKKKL